MPRKIEEIKDFLLTARRKDAKCECGAAGAPRGGPGVPAELLGLGALRDARCRVQ